MPKRSAPLAMMAMVAAATVGLAQDATSMPGAATERPGVASTFTATAGRLEALRVLNVRVDLDERLAEVSLQADLRGNMFYSMQIICRVIDPSAAGKQVARIATIHKHLGSGTMNVTVVGALLPVFEGRDHPLLTAECNGGFR